MSSARLTIYPKENAVVVHQCGVTNTPHSPKQALTSTLLIKLASLQPYLKVNLTKRSPGKLSWRLLARVDDQPTLALTNTLLIKLASGGRRRTRGCPFK